MNCLKNFWFVALVFYSQYSFSQSKKNQLEKLKSDFRALELENQASNVDFALKLNQKDSVISLMQTNVNKMSLDLILMRDSILYYNQKVGYLENLLDSKSKDLNDCNQYYNDNIDSVGKMASIRFFDNSIIPFSDIQLIEKLGVSQEDMGDSFFCSHDSSKMPEFTLINKQAYEVDGARYIAIVVGVSNPNDCHACFGMNVFGVFKLTDHYEVIDRYFLDAETGWGNYHEIESLQINGIRSFVFFSRGGYGNQGSHYTNRKFVMIHNEKIKIVYDAMAYEQPGPHYNPVVYEWNVRFSDTYDSHGFLKLTETKNTNGKYTSIRNLSYCIIHSKYE